MTTIEKCCRAICKERDIDPDSLVCPLMPEFINASPLINGFYIPPVGTFCKAWELFQHYVTAMLKELQDIDVNGFEDEEVSDDDAATFKHVVKAILEQK